MFVLLACFKQAGNQPGCLAACVFQGKPEGSSSALFGALIYFDTHTCTPCLLKFESVLKGVPQNYWCPFGVPQTSTTRGAESHLSRCISEVALPQHAHRPPTQIGCVEGGQLSRPPPKKRRVHRLGRGPIVYFVRTLLRRKTFSEAQLSRQGPPEQAWHPRPGRQRPRPHAALRLNLPWELDIAPEKRDSPQTEQV